MSAGASTSELEAQVEATRAPGTPPRQRVDALVGLAWHLRLNDPARAHELASEARELAREHAYPLGQARAARTLAMSIRNEEQLRQMFELAHEAKSLFDQAEDDAGRAGARDFLSSLYEHVGDLSTGLDYALDALSIARELNDPVRIGYALSSVGGILSASGELEQGIERLEEALALFQGLNDDLGINGLSSRLARVCRRAGRLDEALAYAELCRERSLVLGDEWGVASALNVLAEVHTERGDDARAEALYLQSIGSLQRQPSRWFVGVEAQVPLARIYLKRGDFAAAREQLEDALSRVRGHSMTVVVEAATREAMAELEEREGRYEAAIEHLKAVQALRSKIAESDARNKLAQVQVRAEMEAAKKDAEIHRLRYVELHAMQAKLVESERMATLGKLAAGTAHELNSPLGVLRSSADLIMSAAHRLAALVPNEPELRARASRAEDALASARETMGRALDRIAQISESFLRFSELDHADRRDFDVREGLESALAILAPSIPPTVRIERRLDEVPPVHAWPRELNHAFMTVIRNAVQAIDGEGRVTLTTRAVDGEVKVDIEDTGRGMDPERVAGLFDVAWGRDGPRTKMRLGLSAAYATLQKHGGRIDVKSTVGHGTVVSLFIPTAGASLSSP